MKTGDYEYTDHFYERAKERFSNIKTLNDFALHLSLIKYQFIHSVAERVLPQRYLVYVGGYPAIVVVREKTLVTIYHARG